MSKSTPKQLFHKSLFACIFIVGMGLFVLLRGVKKKEDFKSVTGSIDYLDTTFQEINYRNNGKHRFIRLKDFPLVFDIFVGKETGDFSPKFEQLDKLSLRDEITIYYAEKTRFGKGDDPRINRTVQFIDKDGEAYFIRGSSDKYMGIFVIGFGLLIVILLFFLKKTGRIT